MRQRDRAEVYLFLFVQNRLLLWQDCVSAEEVSGSQHAKFVLPTLSTGSLVQALDLYVGHASLHIRELLFVVIPSVHDRKIKNPR